MAGTKNDMTRKTGGEPLVIPNGDGYHVKLSDFGTAGIMVTLFRPDWQSGDREASVMVSKADGDKLLYWLERTVGREAMALPVQTQAVLDGLLAKDKAERIIPKADRAVLKEAVKILGVISRADDSDNFNERSRTQRALCR